MVIKEGRGAGREGGDTGYEVVKNLGRAKIVGLCGPHSGQFQCFLIGFFFGVMFEKECARGE